MLYNYYNVEGNVQLSQVDHKNNYCFPIYGCYKDQRSESCNPTVDVHVKLAHFFHLGNNILEL